MPAPMDAVDASAYARSSAPSNGGGGGGAPISNYKGVMLCDRPQPKGPQAQPQVSSTGERMPFSSCIGPVSKFERTGLNPSKEKIKHKADIMSGINPLEYNNFFNKHRKWLRKLRDEKRREKAEQEEDVVKREQRKQKFKEYSSKLRQAIRKVRHDGGGTLTREAVEQHTQVHSRKSTPAKSRKGKKGAKPAWAMTEGEAEKAADADEEDLLNFATGLNFEEYVNDYEVKNALAAMKNRIQDIATHREHDAQDGADIPELDLAAMGDDEWKKVFAKEWNGGEGEQEGDAESVAASDIGSRAQETARSRASVASTRRRGEDGASVASGMSRASRVSEGSQVSAYDAAQDVLSTSRSLRRVHSNSSVRALLKKKAAAKSSRLDAIAEDDVDVGPTFKAPKTTTYAAEDEGDEGDGKPKKRFDPSQLPYLHRNPAI